MEDMGGYVKEIGRVSGWAMGWQRSNNCVLGGCLLSLSLCRRGVSKICLRSGHLLCWCWVGPFTSCSSKCLYISEILRLLQHSLSSKKVRQSVPVTGPVVAKSVGRGIALLFHDRGTRKRWVVSSTPRPIFTPGKDPVHIVQEAGWAPGLVWTGGKSRRRGIRSLDRPARSQSLYRLSYPAHPFSSTRPIIFPTTPLSKDLRRFSPCLPIARVSEPCVSAELISVV